MMAVSHEKWRSVIDKSQLVHAHSECHLRNPREQIQTLTTSALVSLLKLVLLYDTVNKNC